LIGLGRGKSSTEDLLVMNWIRSVSVFDVKSYCLTFLLQPMIMKLTMSLELVATTMTRLEMVNQGSKTHD